MLLFQKIKKPLLVIRTYKRIQFSLKNMIFIKLSQVELVFYRDKERERDREKERKYFR
jgi:hypothetical protein